MNCLTVSKSKKVFQKMMGICQDNAEASMNGHLTSQNGADLSFKINCNGL